ncbi:hypothetical protein [Psychrobacter sp. LV10R520-6]|uniref:hypothetical protein n=1 Tax=Psychrobacter sp. LV10R520-6 TaxID=1415574 RepID=UPI0024C8F340|nr:hypothetical protein [Psychrobacter sp. LV10R520-6]SNT70290.1 hypothetical protein SAMN04488491_1446 [Psychrobacter sp. LV10R520-6]
MIACLKKRLGMVAGDNHTLIHRRATSFHSVSSCPSQRTGNVLLLLLALGTVPVITGCSMPQTDPSQQTIPTDSNQWQKKLGDTFEQLPTNDRQLLSRYMLRMKLSEAYQSGAMPRTTIKQALVQQREYERLHPNNPTGKKSPVVASQQTSVITAQTYPIALLPVKTSDSDSDSLNQVKLQFMLSNHGSVPIKSFKGSLLMKDAKLTQGKGFNVPLTQFTPPITPEQSGKIVIETSIEDINVMRAIRNTQDVTVEINDATLTLTDGKKIEFKDRLAR